MRSSMKKNKILFVINTLGRGGAERSLLNRLDEMEGCGADVDLLILTGMGELVNEVPSYVRILNRKVTDCSVLSSKGRRYLAVRCIKALFFKGYIFRHFKYLTANIRAMRLAGKVYPEKLMWDAISESAPEAPDSYDEAIAYIEGGSAYYVSRRVKALKKTAIIHVDYRKAGYTRLLDGDCYRAFGRIGAVSEDTRKSFVSLYPELSERTFIYENPLNLKRICALKDADSGVHFNGKGFKIFSAMRLVEQKTPELSVEAAAIMKEKGFCFEWIVAGDGPEKNRIERLLKEKGLEGCFVLCGSLDNPYPLMKECDLYAQVTAFEGKSMSVREAAAIGKPVMVSDGSGCAAGEQEIVVSPDPMAVAMGIISFAECRDQARMHPRLSLPEGSAAQRGRL